MRGRARAVEDGRSARRRVGVAALAAALAREGVGPPVGHRGTRDWDGLDGLGTGRRAAISVVAVMVVAVVVAVPMLAVSY